MDKFKQKMEEAINTLTELEGDGDSFICVNWLLVSEWADYEGNRYLHTEVSDSMTPWNAYGMMKMAEEYNRDSIGKIEKIADDEDDNNDGD
jgi:hypothetical protein